MKTYLDIYNEVLKGSIVIITSCYGNTRTYFLNKDNEVRQKFNNCKDNYFIGRETYINNLDLENMEVIKSGKK